MHKLGIKKQSASQMLYKRKNVSLFYKEKLFTNISHIVAHI